MACKGSDTKISFKDTLNLPRTNFPIKANAAVNDPAMIERWISEDLYAKAFVHNEGEEKFILHDGPPYANGNIHLGHAYNKILKDIVTKSQRMMGKQVPVTPGWDCHGLPIEFKVSADNPGVSPQALKKACRAYAAKWVDVQREEFKKLGVVMDWAHPYLTMDHSYEATILRSFGTFVADGYIERKNKTVPWCATCKTVLASAEIEYQDRKDPSIYVAFPLVQDVVNQVWPTLNGKDISLVVWTTTPWTLPLNRAVLLKPDAEYVILSKGDSYLVVAAQLADKLCALLEIDKNIVETFKAQDIVKPGCRAHHPFIEGLEVPLILDQSVQLDEGTAFVHCAPGCGPEDYEVGVRNNLEIFSPISPYGTYINGIQPPELEGMSVADGQIWVIKKLAALGRLLVKKTITHSYPHCWRCRNPLIFRATRQWFCDLEKGKLKERAIAAVDTIAAVPEKSINRLRATIEGRLEWCLSRQRIWGVPIPALLCVKCDYTYITQGLVEKVAQEVEKLGIEYWDDAVPAQLLPPGFSCPLCKGIEFKCERDILDVWFDSGISHEAVLKKISALAYPADMYLEGKDQHRGWFQSSLLTAMVLNDSAPMKTIVTHGFTVDEQGRKMSKSLGNGVEPQTIMDQISLDGLRLWAASIDCSGEAVVSDQLVRNVGEVFRKIRNTCRFLLSNLYDFDIQRDAIAVEKMLPIDQYACAQLFEMQKSVMHAYKTYDFTAVFHILGDYCSAQLSAFYLDIVKDRLYVEQADGHLRRSAQTVCWYIVDSMTRLMAPILSVTAEQVSDEYQKDKKQSIHLQSFAQVQDAWELIQKIAGVGAMPELELFAKEQELQWQTLKTMRSAILKALETLRAQGTISHSLDARITLSMSPELSDRLKTLTHLAANAGQTLEQFFKEFVIVSQCVIATSSKDLQESIMPGLWLRVEHAQGDKCPRCWQWDVTKNEYKLCSRCQKIVK